MKKDNRLTKYGIIRKGVMTIAGIVKSYENGLYIVQTDANGSTYQFEDNELFPLPKKSLIKQTIKLFNQATKKRNAISFLHERGYTNPLGIEYTAGLLVEYLEYNTPAPTRKIKSKKVKVKRRFA
jgi:hypothetical protein